METVTPSHYLVLSLILFAIGFFGVLLRRNLLLVLMSLELMLNGINLALVNFSRTALNLDGSIFVFFIIIAFNQNLINFVFNCNQALSFSRINVIHQLLIRNNYFWPN